MAKPRKDVKLRVKLPPDVHDWLEEAIAQRADHHMYRDRMVTEALRYYMTQPEDALGTDGRRVCCGTDPWPASGHRGTCRFSSMRSATSMEAQALRRMWQSQAEQ
jgi:hypothetical protein